MMMIQQYLTVLPRSAAIFCTGSRRSVMVLTLICTLISVTGCTALVRPNFETETVKLRPGNYSLDPDHTFVLFRVGHLELSKVIGRFNEVEATLQFDPEKVEELRLDGRLATNSIDLNNETFESQLKGKDWLDSEQFPDAKFVTNTVVVGNDGQLSIEGDLSLRGVTRPIVLDARFNGGADNILSGKYTIGFSATSSFSRKDFGIDDFAALVGDTIELEIEAEFQKQ